MQAGCRRVCRVNLPSASGQSTVRSALLGAASGLRSQLGVAAVVVGPESHRVPSVLRTRTAKSIAAALAGGELLFDKYPGAPNRTDPPAVVLRMALGAGSAGLLARSEQEPPGPAASLGALSALGATFGGFIIRRRLSARYPALLVALAEDALALGMAALAVTRFAGPSRTA
jgi:uncharacterized membrane protein